MSVSRGSQGWGWPFRVVSEVWACSSPRSVVWGLPRCPPQAGGSLAPPAPSLGFSGLTPSPARLQETSEDVDPPLPTFHFQQLLANLTALRIRAGGQSASPPGQ